MTGHSRWMVFGGSWGSTLALLMPDPCRPGHRTRASRRLHLSTVGTGLALPQGRFEIFPDKWEAFLAPIPAGERDDLVAAYHRRLTGDDPSVQLEAARAWSRWETETVTLLPGPEVTESEAGDAFAIAIARIENHYMINRGWIEEGALIRDAARLRDIPSVIVQGRMIAALHRRSPPGICTGLSEAS